MIITITIKNTIPPLSSAMFTPLFCVISDFSLSVVFVSYVFLLSTVLLLDVICSPVADVPWPPK